MLQVAFGLLLCAQLSLSQRFGAIAEEAHARVGVYTLVLETNQWASLNNNSRYDTQSTYKVPISMAVLDKAEHGQLSLDKLVHIGKKDLYPGVYSPLRDAHPNGGDFKVSELIRDAIIESDNTASDALLKLAGGPGAVNAYLRRIGVQYFHVGASETEGFYLRRSKNWTTPGAAANLLATLYTGRALTRIVDTKLILDCMHRCTTSPGRIKGMLPANTWVAHKTVSWGAVSNDMGIVELPNRRHLVIAVFEVGTRGTQADRDKVIAKIARTAYDVYGRN